MVPGISRASRGVRGYLLTYLIAALACLACVLSGPALAQDTEDEGPYRIMPGDTVLVGVLEDAELSAQVLVLPDGRISLPVAGTIMAGGRTPDELSRVIRSRLAGNFVNAPTITVSLTSLAPEDEDEDELSTVFVLGEVSQPGAYEYDPEEPITVLKALTLAGGLGPFAARTRIQIREELDGTEVLRLFDYEAVEEGLINTSRDLATLADGAVIVVPERGLFE